MPAGVAAFVLFRLGVCAGRRAPQEAYHNGYDGSRQNKGVSQ
jgi:hypothetical protein